MFKFLRKYKAWLIGGFGSFLMVAFLMPQAIQMIAGNALNTPAAEFQAADGKVTLTQGDLMELDQELRVLRNLSSRNLITELVPTQQGLQFVPSRRGIEMQSVADELGIESTEHWAMLVSESERLGLIGWGADGQRLIDELAVLRAQRYIAALGGRAVEGLTGTPQEQAQQMAEFIRGDFASTLPGARGRLAQIDFDRALGRAAGVARLYTELYPAPTPVSVEGATDRVTLSRPELEKLVRDRVDALRFDVAVVDAERLGRTLPEPTDAEIDAHFETYKAVNPATDGMGFGYLQPAAARVEVLTLSRAEIEAQVVLEDIPVNTRWQQSREVYPGDFTEERERVEADMRAEIAERVIGTAADTLRARMEQSRLTLPPSETDSRYVVVPEGYARTPERRLETLAAEAARAAERELGNVQEGAADAAFTVTPAGLDLKSEGELFASGEAWSQAFYRVSGQQVPFFLPQMVMLAKEIEQGTDEAAQLPPIQEGLLFGPLETVRGDRVWFRVIEAKPEGPPAHVAQVREQVVTDVRTAQAYAQLEAAAGDYQQQVGAGDFGAIIDQQGVSLESDLRVTRQEVSRVTRQGSPAFNTDDFRTAIFEHAELIFAEDFAQAPLAERVFVLPVPQANGLVIAKLTAHDEPTLEQYRRASSPILLPMIKGELLREAVYENNPLSLEKLGQRLGYKSLNTRSDDEQVEQVEQAEEVDAVEEAATETESVS